MLPVARRRGERVQAFLPGPDCLPRTLPLHAHSLPKATISGMFDRRISAPSGDSLILCRGVIHGLRVISSAGPLR